ncbi:UNVERIFIED_CONTAM: hypothetical protein RF653_05280 [Kocuria sp. CPCC 205316]|uniref:hypothetical protein n=1 Tax=Kocuria TaxID=57493 RepID=UPI0036DC0F9E
MSSSSNDRAPLSVEMATPVADGVLRAMDLSHLDPADTLTYDRSVSHIFRDAARPGAATHPDRDEAVATVLLLAAATSTRNVYHYRAQAHGPRSGSPWKWDPIEYRSGATLLGYDVVKTPPSELHRP